MKIVAREDRQYRIACQGGHDFKAPRHSISVECPCCGKTENTRKLIDQLLDLGEAYRPPLH